MYLWRQFTHRCNSFGCPSGSTQSYSPHILSCSLFGTQTCMWSFSRPLLHLLVKIVGVEHTGCCGSTEKQHPIQTGVEWWSLSWAWKGEWELVRSGKAWWWGVAAGKWPAERPVCAKTWQVREPGMFRGVWVGAQHPPEDDGWSQRGE